MSSSDRPAVSVIIPVFNGMNYLGEAIDSVLAQTFTDYELLVVDDGSTDGTWEIVKSYGTRVRGLQKPNGGVASALNLGISEAKGRWVAWLSHDDLFLPNKLLRQVGFLSDSPRFSACYTGFYVIDSRGNILRVFDPPWYPREQAVRALFRRTYMNGSTMLIKKKCFDRIGLFDERLKHTQDVDMWIRLVQCFEVGRVSERLVKWRLHPAQGSRNVSVQASEEQSFFSRLYDELGITGVFPELSESSSDPKVQARGYEWIGDTMLVHRRRWYALAIHRYHQAIMAWPSWRNRARLKIPFVKLLAVIVPRLRRVFHTLRMFFPTS